MIEYAFKFLCFSGVFYLFYYLILKQDTFFQRNRWFLLLSLVASLVLPFFKFSFEPKSDNIKTQMLETFYAGGEQAQIAFKSIVWSLEWHEALWAVVSLVISIYSVWQLIKIFRLANSLHQEKKKDYTVVYTDGKMPTFSFLNYLFWDNTISLDETSANSVWQHELIHIKQKHSLDLLFVQILKNIFWFNPFLHLYNKALRQQHEFIADASVTSIISKKDYQHALVSVLFKNLNPGFVHSFNKCQIKKRIEKMNQFKTPKSSLWKMTGILPMLFCMVLLFSTERAIAQSGEDKVFEQADEAASPKGGIEMLMKGLQKELKYPKDAKKAGTEGKVYLSFVVNTDGTLSDVSVVKGLEKSMDIAAIEAVKNLDLKWNPAKKDGKLVRQKMTMPIQFSL